MYSIYNFFLILFLPSLFLRLTIKARTDTDYLRGWLQRLGIYNLDKVDVQNSLWFHAVSVGEVVAASSLIDECLKLFPDYNIVITVSTPTGKKRANNFYSKNNQVVVVYLPYDLDLFIKRFLDIFKPKIAIVLETEIWPNMLRVASRKKIPIILANARLSKKSCRSYARIKKFTAEVMSNLSLIGAQSRQDLKRFNFLSENNSPKILTLGNIKYDFAKKITMQKTLIEYTSLENRLVIMAASTHPGEEEIILNVYRNLKPKFSNLVLICAPRHSFRSKSLFEHNKANFPEIRSTLYSDYIKSKADADVIFIDEMGVMLDLYRASDVVFVGGSFIEHGGKNPIEPAALQKAILMGPSRYNFSFVTRQLIKCGGLLPVNNHIELQDKIIALLESKPMREKMGKAAIENVISLSGATHKHLEFIKCFLRED
ncbi:MAG: 3-deoxy-D-manno-octulosonic acid transferase [Pseudomonadota bacterium]|nr:3-deoxy-D-manno-octulosonic acid transferase [Pseudomonadota bacterium]